MTKAIFVSLLFCFTGVVNAQYQIRGSAFGGGGIPVSNSEFQISSTIGQTFIGQALGSNVNLESGFWPNAQIVTPVLGVVDLIPRKATLDQNYPNPFNPTTTINYDIPKLSHVMMIVYDVLGRKVQMLVNAEKSPGRYEATFDASRLTSGVYFYRLTAGTYTRTKKMLFIK